MDHSGSYMPSRGMTTAGLTQLSDSMDSKSYWTPPSTGSVAYGSHTMTGSPCNSDMASNMNAYHLGGSIPISRACSQSSTDYAASMQRLDSSTGSTLGMVPSPTDRYESVFSPEQTHIMDPGLAGEYPYGHCPYSASLDQSYPSAVTDSIKAETYSRWTSMDSELPNASAWAASSQMPASTTPQESWWTGEPVRAYMPGVPIPYDGERFEQPSRQTSHFLISRCSTIRPHHGMKRPSIPGPQDWHSPQASLGSYGSPVSMFHGHRRSSEGENSTARNHPLYHVKMSHDNKYYCIYEENGRKCKSAPFRLKCNYE